MFSSSYQRTSVWAAPLFGDHHRTSALGALSAVALLNWPVTVTGVVLEEVPPLPSWPFVPRPAHFTTPAVSIEHWLNGPEVTATVLAVDGTSVGAVSGVAVPLPTWPLAF